MEYFSLMGDHRFLDFAGDDRYHSTSSHKRGNSPEEGIPGILAALQPYVHHRLLHFGGDWAGPQFIGYFLMSSVIIQC